MSNYRYSFSLRPRHPSIAPQGMTDALDLQPSRSWRAGEPRSTPQGTPLSGVNSHIYWTTNLGKGGWPPTSLPTAIGVALDVLFNRRAFLHQVRAEDGQAEFFIGWFFESQSGDTLPYNLLARAADLGIDLSFDVYPLLLSPEGEQSAVS